MMVMLVFSLPLGTGNGMVKSLLDPAGDLCSIPNATFAVIRGNVLFGNPILVFTGSVP